MTGPTVEVIDPVRFVSNRSSGKMGYAFSEALRNRGARYISNWTNTTSDPIGVDVIHIESAEEMFEAVTTRFDKQDIVIKANCFRLYANGSIRS